MSARKKRTTANSTRGASSSLDEELNPFNQLTRERAPRTQRDCNKGYVRG
jgi:hypothetical protein